LEILIAKFCTIFCQSEISPKYYLPLSHIIVPIKEKQKKLQTQINSKFTANHITAGDRDRTFLTSQNPHGKELSDRLKAMVETV